MELLKTNEVTEPRSVESAQRALRFLSGGEGTTEVEVVARLEVRVLGRIPVVEAAASTARDLGKPSKRASEVAVPLIARTRAAPA